MDFEKELQEQRKLISLHKQQDTLNTYVKAKVSPVHSTKAYSSHKGIALLILNHDPKWRRVVDKTSRPVNLREANTGTH